MIKPIRNNVLFKAFKQDATSMGGIIVPESYRKDGCKVEILAVGDGTKKQAMTLKPGIAYRIHEAGQPFIYEGETVYLGHQNIFLAQE